MTTIWKYSLKVTDQQELQIPKGGELLCVQTQADGPCLWVKVDDAQPKVNRYFAIYGTGNPIRDITQRYIGTFQMHKGALVFHLYELL